MICPDVLVVVDVEVEVFGDRYSSSVESAVGSVQYEVGAVSAERTDRRSQV
jgi:hypothetical protein